MVQVFSSRADTVFRVAIAALVLGVFGSGWLLHAAFWSPYTTRVDLPINQPVPFSHEHHAAVDGLDCRYCHTTVEVAASAGMPATEICMTCHSRLWTDSAALQPVRDSLTDGRPLRWSRVNDLPDFVYFDHSAHLNAKDASGKPKLPNVDASGQPMPQCQTCHGKVQEMDIVSVQHPFNMQWCLNCHRDPKTKASTDCAVCHR